MRLFGCGVLALAISGALLSLTQATLAQASRTTPRIGVLQAGDETPNAMISGFRHGLRELGYSDGQNIHIEHRWALGRLDRLIITCCAAASPGGCFQPIYRGREL